MYTALINVDWLAFSIELADDPESRITGEFQMKCPQGYRLEVLPGNNIYKHRAILYTEDARKCVTMLWTPYSKVIQYNLCLVEIANEWLYNPNGWQQLLSVLHEVHAHTFRCMSRLDICCDWCPDAKGLKMIQDIAANNIYIKGYREGSVFWHKIDSQSGKVTRQAHCISHGSKQSSVKWKLYNKTMELASYENGHIVWNKPYIVDAWEKNGLDPNKVWRLEVSICNAHSMIEQETKDKLRLQNLTDEAIVSLFISLYNEKYVQRLNQGHVNKHNDPRAYIINFATSYEAKTLRKKEYGEPQPASADVEQYRALLRALNNTAARCNARVFEHFATAVVDFEALAHLESYAFRTLGMSTEQYCANLYQDVGGGIVEFNEPPRDILD